MTAIDRVCSTCHAPLYETDAYWTAGEPYCSPQCQPRLAPEWEPISRDNQVGRRTLRSAENVLSRHRLEVVAGKHMQSVTRPDALIGFMRLHQPIWANWLPDLNEHTWYFVRVMPTQEASVAYHLRKQGATVWWPQVLDYRVQWKRQDIPQERIRVQPLNPGVLWIAGNPNSQIFYGQEWPRYQGPDANTRWPYLYGLFHNDTDSVRDYLVKWARKTWIPYLQTQTVFHWAPDAPVLIAHGPYQGQLGLLRSRTPDSLRLQLPEGPVIETAEANCRPATMMPHAQVYCDRGPYAGYFGQVLEDHHHTLTIHLDSDHETHPVSVKRTQAVTETLIRPWVSQPVEQTVLSDWLQSLEGLAEEARQTARPVKVIKQMRKVSHNLTTKERQWEDLAPKILHQPWESLDSKERTQWKNILPE